MTDEEKRYSDNELSLILQTALELEKKSLQPGRDGFRLSEVEEIAQATGIPVGLVRQAAAEMSKKREERPARFWFGAPTSFECSAIVPEALSRAELDQLDRALPALTSHAESRMAGDGTIQWKRGILKSFLDGFPLKLQVRPGDQGTEIHARANLRSIAAILFPASAGIGMIAGLKLSLFAMLLVGFGAVGVPLGVLVGALGSLAGLGAFWCLARLVFRSYAKHASGRLAELVGGIKTAVRTSNKKG